MNKRLKQIVCTIFMMCMCISLQIGDVHAAGVSAKPNKSSITLGSSFNVTVTANDCYATISASTNNGSISGGGADADNGSVTFSVKPSHAGTCTVTFKGTYAAYSGNSADVSYSKTVTVQVNEKSSSGGTSTPSTTPSTPTVDNRSKENALSSLTVSEGQLSPSFSANTTKYTVNLDGDKTKITINAKAKDSKAKVSGTGEKDLKVGKNTFVVKCTAENGSNRNYTIEVNVDEKPVVFAKLGEQNLGVVRNLEGVNAPSGFEKGKTKISDQEVDAWTNEKLKLTVCYMVSDDNKKAFYVIEDGKISYEYKNVEIDGRHFIVIPIEENQKERAGFQFQTVQIRELKLDGWVYVDQAMKNYVQVYLMNENGDKNFYDFETSENQLQIYTEPSKEEKQDFNIFIITTIGFAALSGGLLFMYLNFKKKSISAIKDYYDHKESQ